MVLIIYRHFTKLSCNTVKHNVKSQNDLKALNAEIEALNNTEDPFEELLLKKVK